MGVEGLLVGFWLVDGVDYYVCVEFICEVVDGLDDVDFVGVDGVGGVEGVGLVKFCVIGVDCDDLFGVD